MYYRLAFWLALLQWKHHILFPLYCWSTYVSFSNFRNNENVKWKHSNEITLLLHYNYSYQNYERHFGIHEKCPIFLFDVNQSCDFWADFLKIRQCQISWNSFHIIRADTFGDTDRRMYEQTERRTGAFVDYVKEHKILHYCILCLCKYIINVSV